MCSYTCAQYYIYYIYIYIYSTESNVRTIEFYADVNYIIYVYTLGGIHNFKPLGKLVYKQYMYVYTWGKGVKWYVRIYA